MIYSIPKSIRQKVISLHERMGHANTEAMCDALAGEAPAWTHTDITPTQVRRVMKRHRCLICHLTKRPRPPIAPPSGDRRDVPPGYCLSGDIVPVSPPSPDGCSFSLMYARDICSLSPERLKTPSSTRSFKLSNTSTGGDTRLRLSDPTQRQYSRTERWEATFARTSSSTKCPLPRHTIKISLRGMFKLLINLPLHCSMGKISCRQSTGTGHCSMRSIAGTESPT